MRSNYLRSGLVYVLLTLFGLAFSCRSEAQFQYYITDLQPVGTSAAYGMNDLGQVVGARDLDIGTRAYVWDSTHGFRDLGTLPKYPDVSLGAFITNKGQITGSSSNNNGGSHFHAFLWQNGFITDLGTLSGYQDSEGGTMNDKGQILLHALNYDGRTLAQGRPFLWDQGIITELNIPGAYTANFGRAGDIYGWMQTKNGKNHAYLYRNGIALDLGTLPGDLYSYARGCNASDQIVGFSSNDAITRAFLWQNNTMTELGTLGENSDAYSINDYGIIVGASTLKDGSSHAFIYANGLMQDLNNLIPPNSGWVLQSPQAINNQGQICGYGLRNGVRHAFLLTPIEGTVIPNHGGNTGQVTVSILKSGVLQGATVKLVVDGQPDVVGQNTTIAEYNNSTLVKTTFDLNGATPGPRQVVIVQPDNTILTLGRGFTVELGGTPSFTTQVVGRSNIRGGAWTTYFVQVQNTGNVDANASELRLEFPNYFQWQVVDTQVSDTFNGNNNTAIGVQLASIPAGSLQTVSLRVKVPDDPKYGHKPFQILTWVNSEDDRLEYLGDASENLIARIGSADGVSVDFSGTMRAVRSVRVTSPSGFTATTAFGGTGLPVSVSGSNGSSVSFRWPTSTVAVVTPTSSSGQIEADFTVNFDNSTLHTPDLPSMGPCIDCEALDKLLHWGCLFVTFVEAVELFDPEPDSRIALHVFQIVMNHLICDDIKDIVKHFCDSQSCLQGSSVTSGDPNEIAGPSGFSIPQWVQGSQPLPYAVFFANKPDASTPAAEVIVTDHLDATKMDLTSFSLGTITLSDKAVTPTANISPIEGVREYNADVDMRPAKNLIVHVNASLNLSNSLLTFRFISIDPNTGLPLAPDDPNGFLDPGQEGSILFTVLPNQALSTGTLVQNQASIVFDANAAMNTPVWFNTLDNDKPRSQVNQLAGMQNSLSFPVSWKGQDIGSGVSDFTIYVSDNGGAWMPWLTNTTDTSATFTGVGGHTYAFYSQARDNVFNLEDAHPQPDTITQLPNIATDVSAQVSVTRGGFRLNRATGRFVQTITLKNTGSSPVAGPIALVLDGLSSNAGLFNKTGVTNATTPTGSPYITVQAGDMAAGASVSVTLEFTNSDLSKGITYTTRVLAGSGSR